MCTGINAFVHEGVVTRAFWRTGGVMDPQFSLDSATAFAQDVGELLHVTHSEGLDVLGSVAFQRRITVAVARGGINFVVSGLSSMRFRSLRIPGLASLAAGAVTLCVILPIVRLASLSTLEDQREDMSIAMQLSIFDCVRFHVLTDGIPTLVLSSLI